jgi:hypothetical protein
VLDRRVFIGVGGLGVALVAAGLLFWSDDEDEIRELLDRLTRAVAPPVERSLEPRVPRARPAGRAARDLLLRREGRCARARRDGPARRRRGGRGLDALRRALRRLEHHAHASCRSRSPRLGETAVRRRRSRCSKVAVRSVGRRDEREVRFDLVKVDGEWRIARVIGRSRGADSHPGSAGQVATRRRVADAPTRGAARADGRGSKWRRSFESGRLRRELEVLSERLAQEQARRGDARWHRPSAHRVATCRSLRAASRRNPRRRARARRSPTGSPPLAMSRWSASMRSWSTRSKLAMPWRRTAPWRRSSSGCGARAPARHEPATSPVASTAKVEPTKLPGPSKRTSAFSMASQAYSLAASGPSTTTTSGAALERSMSDSPASGPCSRSHTVSTPAESAAGTTRPTQPSSAAAQSTASCRLPSSCVSSASTRLPTHRPASSPPSRRSSKRSHDFGLGREAREAAPQIARRRHAAAPRATCPSSRRRLRSTRSR